MSLFLVASLASSPVPALEVSHSSGSNEWKVSYEFGPEPIKRGKKVWVTFTTERIEYVTKEGERFAIPVSTVIYVTYDRVASHYTKDFLRESGGGHPYGWLGALLLGVVVDAIKGSDHFVRIVWEEDADQKEILFKASGNDYATFLAELERVTGLRVTDFAKVRGELLEELEREKQNKVSIRVDRPVWVSGKKLKPDQYQLVFLANEEGRGQLYFFRGRKAKPKKVVATVPVEIIPEEEERITPQVAYDGNENRPATIKEVRLPGRRLRFPPEYQLLGPYRLIFEKGRPNVQFQGKDGFAILVTYVDYKGTPAVRYPVSHDHDYWLFCFGVLYLTRDRIAYEIYPGLDQDHAFEAERSQIREIKRDGPQGIRVVLPHRKYKFIPFFFRGLGRHPALQAEYSDLQDFLFLTLENFDAVEEEFQHVLASRKKLGGSSDE